MAVEGVDEVLSNLRGVMKEAEGVSEQAIEDITLDLRNKSVNLAPLDWGALRRSAYSDVQRTRDGIVGEVGYNEVYAHKMHEDLTYTPQKPGTGPKYLENPLKVNQRRYKRHIENEFR